MAKQLADDRQRQAGVDSVYGVGDIGPAPLDVLLAFSDGFLNCLSIQLKSTGKLFDEIGIFVEIPGA